MTDKAVPHGKVTAAQVAQLVFDARRAQRFYLYSHPQALAAVQVRLKALKPPAALRFDPSAVAEVA